MRLFPRTARRRRPTPVPPPAPAAPRARPGALWPDDRGWRPITQWGTRTGGGGQPPG